MPRRLGFPDSFALSAEFVDLRDVGGTDRRGQPSFPKEIFAALGIAETSAGRTLIVTVRPKTVSSAFQTTPVPPSPIFSISR